MLSSFLVDELKSIESQKGLPGNVCYFFFKDDNKVQSSALFALRALLHQALTARSSLPSAVRNTYINRGGTMLNQFPCLWELFKSTATDKGGRNTICILDGLDECEDTSRRELITAMVDYFGKGKTESEPYLKVIMTSRPDNFIKISFSKLPTIRVRGNVESELELSREDVGFEIEAEDTEHDVKLVVEHSLKEFVDLHLITHHVKQLLQTKLVATADHTFLYVSLIITLLRDATEYGASENELLAVLDDRSIDSLYAKFLARCLRKPGVESRAKVLLQIIVAATRPLTLSELDVAICLQVSDKSLEDLQPNLHSSPENYFRQLCGHFIRCRNGNVYLVHQTARTFLLCQDLEQDVSQTLYGPLWHYIRPTAAQALLGDICSRYLFLTDFKSVPDAFGSNPWADAKTRERFCSSHPFLLYAASHWQYHFRLSGDSLTSAMALNAWTLCDTRSLRFWTWFYIAGHRWSSGVAIECTAVYYLAIGNILEQHSTRLKEADSEMSNKKTPNSRITGLEKKGKMKEEARKDEMQNKDITPLPWAAREGHLTLIKILLDHLTPKICITNRPQARLALHLALQGCNIGGPESSHSKIAKLLVQKGAPVLDELYAALKDNNQVIVRTLANLDLLPKTTSRENSEFWQNMSSRELGSLVKLADQFISTLERKGVDSKALNFLDLLRKSLELRRVKNAESEEKMRRPGLGQVFNDPFGLPSSGVVGSFSTTVTEMGNPFTIVTEKKLRPSNLNELGYLSERLSRAKVLAGEGNYYKAVTTYESVLVGFREKLGANHSDTLECVRLLEEAQWLSSTDLESCAKANNHALELWDQNKLDEAIPELKSTLAAVKRILGDNHQYTLTCLDNMGGVLCDYGDLEGAERMQINAVRGFCESLGSSHTLTIGSMHNLAVTLEHQQRYSMAEVCHRWVSFAYEAVLGQDHPHTRTSKEILSAIWNMHDYLQLEGQEKHG